MVIDIEDTIILRRDMWHMTRDMQHVTCDMGHSLKMSPP